MLLSWVISGIFFMGVVFIMNRNETKAMRRDERVIDPIFRSRNNQPLRKRLFDR